MSSTPAPTFLTTRKNSVITFIDLTKPVVFYIWHKGKDEKDFTHFTNFLF